MHKFILGIIAVMCVHMAFVAYMSTGPSGEVAEVHPPPAMPVTEPLLGPPSDPGQIMIARGNGPVVTLDQAVADTYVNDEPVTIAERFPAKVRSERTGPAPRTIRAVKSFRPRTETIYRSDGYTVERTEFKPRSVVADRFDNESGDPEIARGTERSEKRSFISKVGSIVKKPYDGLKAVASIFN